MRIQLIAAAAVLLLSAAGATAQTVNPALVGAWKSAPDEMTLTSDFDTSVWGAGATSVRTVDLVVRPSGEATLAVVKKVVDARGRTVPASTWVEEAQLMLGAAQEEIAARVEHDTTVVSAVRLFPDDPDYKWTLDGLRVRVVTFSDGDGSALEIRYDTPEGKGSFWETLRRDKVAAPRRGAR
jgi:hypothetical protein